MSGPDHPVVRAVLLLLLLGACAPPPAEPQGGAGISVNVGGSLRAYYGNVSR